MANISSASGTITLKGDWTQKAIDAFKPVLDSWAFYGQYGIHDYNNELSLKNKTTGFYGCGRWDFSGTLDSFDDWTRDWIKTNPASKHPLTAEQYDEFLQIMCDKNLKIEITFTDDKEDGNFFNIKETGVFTSDGESLSYETISCESTKDTWESLGCENFDAAVNFFAQFAVNPDKKELQKWAKEFTLPNNCYRADFCEFLEDNFMDFPFVKCSDAIYDFENRFEINPDSDWSSIENFVSSFYGWYFDAENKNVKFDLESDEEFDKWYQELQEY